MPAVNNKTLRGWPDRHALLRGAAYALVAFLLVDCRPAAALDLHRTLTQAFRRIWQVQQGLPQATISCILQTREGYLWLGTSGGLVRFDGVRFTPLFDHSAKLDDSIWIRALCQGLDGALWIATDGDGLIRLHNGRAQQFTRRDGLPSENLRALIVDQGGVLWIATDAGLARYEAGTFRTFGTRDGLPTQDLRALALAADGTIWAAGEGNRLAAWDGKRFTTEVVGAIHSREMIRALVAAEDGSLWLGTSSGLVRVREKRQTRWTAQDGLADNWIHSLAAGAGQTLWVGTNEGFSRVRPGEQPGQLEIESYGTRDGLSQSTVYTLVEDHEGSLWVGTKHGLNQFIDRRLLPFTTSEGLPTNDVGPLAQDDRGTIWVGTIGAGLASYDGRRFSVTGKQEGLPSDKVISLAVGEPGELWIGTDAGLAHSRDKKILATYTTADGLPSGRIRCLCRGPGGALWAGTDRGLAVLVNGRFKQPGGTVKLEKPVLALASVGDRYILAATGGGGMYRATPEGISPVEARELPTRSVGALNVDKDGSVWIGTQGGGLWRIEGSETFHYRIKDGLYDDEIYGIVADAQDRLWMACSKGIFFIVRDDFRKFSAGVLPKLVSTPFTPTDALRTIECKDGVQPPACQMRDGRIWFSTIRGLIVIDPNHLQRTLPPPNVLIEELTVNGKQESLGPGVRLGPGSTNVSIRYTALSLASPTRTLFRYKLEGFDKEWVEAGSRREAFYTNLSPGKYRFRVAAQPFGRTYTEAALPLDFQVRPLIYQRGWFLPLCGALLCFAAWAMMRLRVRRVRAQLQAVLTERSRIARELHDTLMQGFSGVTMEMQALAARLPRSAEQATLEEIIVDAGRCLRDARRSVAGLRNRSGSVAWTEALAETARHLTETQGVRLRLKLEDCRADLPPQVEYDLLRIAQEAISNAVKHAGCSTIDVSLTSTAGELRLSIVDDGSGISEQVLESPQAGHYGLIGMRERAAQIGALLELSGEAGRGTRVTVVLPERAAAQSAPDSIDRVVSP